MIITWFGQSFFEIRVKNRAGDLFNIAIDPYDESIGLKLPKNEAEILLITHDHSDHNNKKAIKGDYFLINEPGEYEVKGVLIKAIPSFHDNSQGKEKGSNIIYKIEAENIKLCHLGNFGQKELDEKQIDELGQVDVLFVSLSGLFTDSKHASSIISQIEPKIIIPMHYKIPKLKLPNITDDNSKFLKQMGIEKIEPEKKLKISVRDIPNKDDQSRIIVLEPNN